MSAPFQPRDPQRFEAALRRFDAENARDPKCPVIDGEPQPYELVYAEWLTDWVLRLCPEASEALRLAARSQHLCRWQIPRHTYPMTRAGYLQWREGLKRFHAQKAAEILREVGYSEDVIQRVQQFNLKQGLPQDLEAQVLEDALCLVFLERQFPDLAAKTSEEKMVNALQKAWKKMSSQGQTFALTLVYGAREKALLDQALAAIT